MSFEKSVKVFLPNQEVRRFIITDENFNNFCQKVEEVCSLNLKESSLKYLDIENDQILLSNEEEFAQALKFHSKGCMKLSINHQKKGIEKSSKSFLNKKVQEFNQFKDVRKGSRIHKKKRIELKARKAMKKGRNGNGNGRRRRRSVVLIPGKGKKRNLSPKSRKQLKEQRKSMKIKVLKGKIHFLKIKSGKIEDKIKSLKENEEKGKGRRKGRRMIRLKRRLKGIQKKAKKMNHKLLKNH